MGDRRTLEEGRAENARVAGLELAKSLLTEEQGFCRIDLLIDFLDIIDEEKGWTDKDVQKELRRWKALAFIVVASSREEEKESVDGT